MTIRMWTKALETQLPVFFIYSVAKNFPRTVICSSPPLLQMRFQKRHNTPKHINFGIGI